MLCALFKQTMKWQFMRSIPHAMRVVQILSIILCTLLRHNEGHELDERKQRLLQHVCILPEKKTSIICYTARTEGNRRVHWPLTPLKRMFSCTLLLRLLPVLGQPLMKRRWEAKKKTE